MSKFMNICSESPVQFLISNRQQNSDTETYHIMNSLNILFLYFKVCEYKTLLHTFLFQRVNTDIHYKCMMPCYVNVKKKTAQNIKA